MAVPFEVGAQTKNGRWSMEQAPIALICRVFSAQKRVPGPCDL